MAKLKWNRANGGYTELPQAPSMPKPWTDQARRAWSTLKKNKAEKQQLVNRPPEQQHAGHLAYVPALALTKTPQLWCRDCGCQIIELTEEEYQNYLIAFPPKLSKKSKE